MKSKNLKPVLTILTALAPVWALAQTPAPTQKSAPVQTLNSIQAKPKIQKLNNPILIKRDIPLNGATKKSLERALGGMNSGGGDICEQKIEEIRDDLKLWINHGGPETGRLALPAGLSLEQYKSGMLAKIQSAQISCIQGFVPNPVEMDGVPKTCRFDSGPQGDRITCDYEKFMGSKNQAGLSIDDKYKLIHHEYAGLAGFEKPAGAKSTYGISKQISAFLETQVVRKLAVKAPASTKKSADVLDDLNQLLKAMKTDGSDLTRSYFYSQSDYYTRYKINGTCSSYAPEDVMRTLATAIERDLIASLNRKGISIASSTPKFKFSSLTPVTDEREFYSLAKAKLELSLETAEGVKLAVAFTSFDLVPSKNKYQRPLKDRQPILGIKAALTDHVTYDHLGRLTTQTCEIEPVIDTLTAYNVETNAVIFKYAFPEIVMNGFYVFD